MEARLTVQEMAAAASPILLVPEQGIETCILFWPSAACLLPVAQLRCSLKIASNQDQP